MATTTNNDIAKAIYLASVEHTTDVAASTLQFLIRKRLLSQAPDILSRLEKLINKAENKIIAKVTSAKKLEYADKTQIEQLLQKRYRESQIIFNEVIDEKVVGGVKIEIDDEVIDLTIKHRINKLAEHLTRYA